MIAETLSRKRRGKIPDPMTDEQRAAALSRVRTSRASLAITGAPLLHKPSLGLLSNPNDPTPEWRSKVGHLIAQATIGKGDVVPQKQYRVKDTLEARSKFPIEIQLALAKFMADATHHLRIPVANWNGPGFLEPTSRLGGLGFAPQRVRDGHERHVWVFRHLNEDLQSTALTLLMRECVRPDGTPFNLADFGDAKRQRPEHSQGHFARHASGARMRTTPVTACAAGVQAIGDAARLIRGGEADVAVCGGAEACIDLVSLGGFAAARALSPGFNETPHRASRPYDRDGDGFVMGEGAGILVIEDLEHALGRGAIPVAEIVGYGTTADTHHMTAGPAVGEGARRAMRIALRQANLAPSDIQHLNAHATSTPLGDIGELAAIKAVFGRDAKIAVSATKSATLLLGPARRPNQNVP